MDDKYTLLADVSRVSFSINDLVLYLDTHPDDQNALEYFRELQVQRKESLAEFEAEYYPLVLDSMGDEAEEMWRWADAPAPWEVEANVEL